MTSLAISNDNHHRAIETYAAEFEAIDLAGLRAVMTTAAGVMASRTSIDYVADCSVSILGALHGSGPSLSLPEVALTVARKHGVTVEDLRGPSRLRRHSRPRIEAYWLALQQVRGGKKRFSTTQVGRFFGDRDHTTVSRGVSSYINRKSSWMARP